MKENWRKGGIGVREFIHFLQLQIVDNKPKAYIAEGLKENF